MPRVLILCGEADEYARLLRAAALPGLDFADAPGAGVDIVFGEPSQIAPLLSALPDLRWVQSTWAGVEPLLAAHLRRDYVLTNARGVFGGLMSEFVFAYLLLHERRILQRLDAQRERRWDSTMTGTLRGKTLGLLGVGSIGAALAETAKFFGMTVRGYTRQSETCPHVDRYYHGQALLEFADRVDYLVSVLPNTPHTRKIVDARLLAALSPSAFFVNVGRGSAVDEAALVRALQSGALAGAVLDVFEQEPLPPQHPLWDAPNVLITCHTAAPSIPQDLARLFVENYRLYIEGHPLRYAVDFERGY